MTCTHRVPIRNGKNSVASLPSCCKLSTCGTNGDEDSSAMMPQLSICRNHLQVTVTHLSPGDWWRHPPHPHSGRLGSDNDTEGDIGSSSPCLHRVNHQFAIQQTKFALTSDHACSVREKSSEICFWTKEWKVTNWLIRDQTKKKPIIFF